MITRIDTSGVVKWQKFYPSLGYADGSWDSKELPNGDIVFSGTKAKIVGSTSFTRLTFTKVDSLGNTKWFKEFGPWNEGHDLFHFLQDENSNYVLSGQISYTATNNTVSGLVYKLNSVATVLLVANINRSLESELFLEI